MILNIYTTKKIPTFIPISSQSKEGKKVISSYCYWNVFPFMPFMTISWNCWMSEIEKKEGRKYVNRYTMAINVLFSLVEDEKGRKVDVQV